MKTKLFKLTYKKTNLEEAISIYLVNMQMQLMFRAGNAPWRPLLVTLLAHRASWRTLHYCLTTLLQPEG